MIRFEVGFNIKKYIKGISVAALFAGAAILFFACENDIEKIKAFSSPEDLPMAEITDFETMMTDSGKISSTLKAPRLLRFEIDDKEFVEFPEGMELRKYDAKGNIVSSISANYAKQDTEEDKWEANNNVVATNVQGDTLKTEHLIWEREKGIIYTDVFVKIIRTDQIYTGIGFTSNEQMGGWKILKPTGTIYINVDTDESEKNNQLTGEAIDSTNAKPNKGELQFEK